MNKRKIIIGMAAGVGAVTALPFLGAVGSVSLAGAILGGTLGGLAGAAAARKEGARCAAKAGDGPMTESSIPESVKTRLAAEHTALVRTLNRAKVGLGRGP